MKITNRISILILLLLSLALLSSCLQRPSGSEGQTTEGGSETEAPPIDLEYTLEMPSQELQERFVNEYIAYQKYEPDTHPPFKMVSWYGSYGDIHFLMIEDGDYHDAEWIDRVADYSFEYSYGNQIKVWVEGQFLNVDDAYVKKFITKDMVANISDIHNNSKYLSMNGNANQEFKLEIPSQELQERFVNEYVAYMNYDPEDHETVAIGSWYGSFGDIHFLLVFDAQVIYTQAHWTDIVAESSFSYPYGHSISVWVNQQFLTMKQAYEQNLITVDMIKTIENLHNGSNGSPIIFFELF